MTTPDLGPAREAKRTATQALLGDTIQLDEEGWRAPSALPGWTRAHVGSHIARNAEGIHRVITGVLSGNPTFMYDSREARNDAIDQGATRSGLEIQQDLDETAGLLNDTLDQLTAEQWAEPLALSAGLSLPSTDRVVLQRLNEVAIHHIDLRIGPTFADLDPTVAGWLLDHNLWRIGDRHPELDLRLVDDTGAERRIGTGEPVTVTGTPQNLLGWLLGRLDNTAVDGAHDVHLPAL